MIIDKILPIRVSLEDELIGADRAEHGITHGIEDSCEVDEHLEGGQYPNSFDNDGPKETVQLDGNTSSTSTNEGSGTIYMRGLNFVCCRRKSITINQEKSSRNPWSVPTNEVHCEENQSFEKENHEQGI